MEVCRDSYREELAERVKLFGRYREFDKSIKSRYEGLSAYEQEIINEEKRSKTHFNILCSKMKMRFLTVASNR